MASPHVAGFLASVVMMPPSATSWTTDARQAALVHELTHTKRGDRRTQAILPLRGKVLNAEQASASKVLNNKELQDIVQALGCGFGPNFDISKMSEGSVEARRRSVGSSTAPRSSRSSRRCSHPSRWPTGVRCWIAPA